MKPGPKPEPASEHAKRGTLQPVRHGPRKDALSGIIEGVAIQANGMPQRPEWLTVEAQMVWEDDVARVVELGFVTERDQTMFAQYCQVVGACNACWKTNAVPPAAYLTEARKLAEMFGILGSKSRVKGKGDAGGATQNPFLKHGRRQ